MMNIKKYLQTIIVLAILTFASGCSDILDIEPKDSISRSEMYNDDKDAFAIKTGLYNTLQELVMHRFVLGELRGDLLVAGPGAKGQKDIMEFFDHNVTEDNKYLDWSGFYKMINQCNDALVSLAQIKKVDSDLKDIVYNQIVGEVLWLRAWSYFTLVKNWGDVPLILEPVYNVEDVKQFQPVSEDIILDQLEKDLAWASKFVFINWAWGPGTGIDKMWNHETVNMPTIIHLWTEILMHRKKYEEAWNQDVLLKILTPQPQSDVNDPSKTDYHDFYNINGTSLNGGEFWFNVQFRYAIESYRSSWHEECLVLAFDSENYAGNGGIFNEKHDFTAFTSNLSIEGGRYLVKPSLSAIINWKQNNDNYRGENYSYYIDQRKINDTVTVNDTIVWKYVGLSPDGRRREAYKTVGNINIVRTSSLYLYGAEVANRLGLANASLEILNQNRDRVGVIFAPVNPSATVEEIEDAIIEERALELAFEGERWYDLLRIAKRRNDPSYLTDRIVKNLPESRKAEIRTRLEQQAANGWKLPYGTKALMHNPSLRN